MAVSNGSRYAWLGRLANANRVRGVRVCARVRVRVCALVRTMLKKIHLPRIALDPVADKEPVGYHQTAPRKQHSCSRLQFNCQNVISTRAINNSLK